MGIQTMGSQGGGQQSHFQPLPRQGSLYNLTLDEVQNHLGDLGKPLGSMNLDELLKNVWSVEGTDLENAAPSCQFTSEPGLQHQGSVTLNRTLSKKTVDEVWKDIQQGQTRNTEERKAQERHPTLGEMTLEDFLVKAGIVEASDNKKRVDGDLQNLEGVCNVGSAPCIDPMTSQQNFPPQASWMQYQLPSLHQQQQQQQNMMGAYIPGRSAPQPLGAGTSPLMDVSYPENQITMSPLLGTLSDTQAPGRKRVAPGDIVEKTVERRQKRMIKNRESAARSRARKQVGLLSWPFSFLTHFFASILFDLENTISFKQAYTNELENKVSRLEEENERLRKQKV